MKEYDKKLQKVISKFLDTRYPDSFTDGKWVVIIDPDFPEDAIIKFRKDVEWVTYKMSATLPIIEYFPPMRRVDAEEYLCTWFEEKFNVHIDAIDNAIVTTFKLKNLI
jgi:hypothetical protein